MGKAAFIVDEALIESFWSSMPADLLDRQSWTSLVGLASTIFEWIEAWYTPERRHSSLENLSPFHYEPLDNNLMVAT